jgi:hypothetical protein
MALKKHQSLSVPELNIVRDEVLFAIVQQFATGTTSSIANQLGRIVSNKVADLQRRAVRQRDNIVPGDSVILLENHRATDDVQAEVEDQEACARIITVLHELRESNPRYYQAIRAHMDGIPVSQHLTHCFGEPVGEDAARKTLERARQQLSQLLAARAEKAS